MVIVGIDAHKRSHTAVAIDAFGRKLGQRTTGTTSEIIWPCWAGPNSLAHSASGPSRTAATYLDDSKPTSSAPVSRSCGCRPS